MEYIKYSLNSFHIGSSSFEEFIFPSSRSFKLSYIISPEIETPKIFGIQVLRLQKFSYLSSQQKIFESVPK